MNKNRQVQVQLDGVAALVISPRRLLFEQLKVSVFWGMLTSANPDRTRSDGQRVVEPQGNHGSSSTGGQPNDGRAVFAPGKMLVPTLPAGIEQRHSFAGLWVNSMDARPFVSVARGASQAQVVSLCRPIFGPRDDMINLARETAEPLGSLTILATVLSANTNGPAQILHFGGGH
jgi:hypothetical protein